MGGEVIPDNTSWTLERVGRLMVFWERGLGVPRFPLREAFSWVVDDVVVDVVGWW